MSFCSDPFIPVILFIFIILSMRQVIEQSLFLFVLAGQLAELRPPHPGGGGLRVQERQPLQVLHQAGLQNLKYRCFFLIFFAPIRAFFRLAPPASAWTVGRAPWSARTPPATTTPWGCSTRTGGTASWARRRRRRGTGGFPHAIYYFNIICAKNCSFPLPDSRPSSPRTPARASGAS